MLDVSTINPTTAGIGRANVRPAHSASDVIGVGIAVGGDEATVVGDVEVADESELSRAVGDGSHA